MESQLVWEERFNIGVDVIDKEHKNLFRVINKLFVLGEDVAKSQWACQESIKYFKSHAIKHFSDEEEYMQSIDYSGYKIHKRVHDNFREQTLPALERELEETEYSQDAVSHFLGVCTGWLVGHTLTEDHAITGKSNSKWKHLMEEHEQETMQQLIIQLMHDVFQLDLKVLSDSYGGEKFGTGIYYRLIYSNKKGEKWETILVFEEKLLINTVGKLMGMKTETVNVMLFNAVRYMARQFSDCIVTRFHAEEKYTLQAENVLTYEQFEKVFQNGTPQFSLLFDTKVGYFAYCAIAPHLKERVGTSIKADNAMVEIGKYLHDTDEEILENSQKNTILVVDDSSVMLEMLKKLFANDYDVSFAQSGLAAIRSLTVNRPDLVLLDYEMPVCDGRQILEMIRAEEDLADIDVIFLTGRTDKESIQNVLSLKPAGYLTKSLKPMEIKQKIDEHFLQAANA